MGAVIGGIALLALVVGLGLWALEHYIRSIEVHAQETIRRAIRGMDIVVSDTFRRTRDSLFFRRFLGSESEIVTETWRFVSKTGTKGRTVHLDALCRTRSGTWFIAEASAPLQFRRKRSTVDLQVLELDESGARRWLLGCQPADYERYFSDKPTIALA
jgi:hypothetical protein